MKIVKVPRVNALGKKGPEKMAEKVLAELGVDGEEIVVGNDDISEDEERIYSGAKRIFLGGEKVVFVGGDHSVTYPIFKAFKERVKDAFLIVFDAHADCMPPMKEPTHEEWLRAVIEKKLVVPQNIVLIGARKIEKEERDFLNRNGIKYFGADCDLESVADFVMEKAREKNVYISIDVDVFEPSVAPGVHYAEPDGLMSRDFFYLFRRFLHLPNLKAIDVVEIVPEIDEKYDYRSVKLGVKIVEGFLNVGK